MNARHAALAAALVGAAFAARALPDVLGADVVPAYETTCVMSEPGILDGYVSNRSLDALQVSGPVQFTFSSGSSMTRPAITVSASGLIASGQTARVARTRLPFQLRPDEQCHLDIKDAVRKL